jgi:hypothetical protein
VLSTAYEHLAAPQDSPGLAAVHAPRSNAPLLDARLVFAEQVRQHAPPEKFAAPPSDSVRFKLISQVRTPPVLRVFTPAVTNGARSLEPLDIS